MTEPTIIGQMDEQLVHLLQQDARQTSEVLAKKLNVSTTTVRRRMRKLIQSGFLRITAVVDPSKVGFSLPAATAERGQRTSQAQVASRL